MFPTEEHWRHFADFCRWEIASGGPDPQIDMVREMSRGLPEEERVWRALCYIAAYNVPYGEVLWMNLSLEDIRRLSHKEVLEWCEQVMGQGLITTRVERRCVRRPDWMAEYLIGARDWEYRAMVEECGQVPPVEAYDVAWRHVTNRPRIGRYVALKLIELPDREGIIDVDPQDIRPANGWSPRKMLQILWPDHTIPQKGNSYDALKAVDSAIHDTLSRLEVEFDVRPTMFQIQVLLCEYRESWESKRQYPGRSLDSELGYARRAEHEWGYLSDIWRARKKLFPNLHLGELHGWDGPRKDVACVLANHGYTWTDLVYDYPATEDTRRPVKR